MFKIGLNEGTPICSDFPQLQISVNWKKQIPEHLTVDKCKLDEGKSKTTAQADSGARTNDRKYRLTASNFGHIMSIRRNHSMHPGTEHVEFFQLDILNMVKNISQWP